MVINLQHLRQVASSVYSQYYDFTGGENANYIPYLASVPNHLSAIAIMTVNGDVISVGCSEYHFAIESISKVCTLALALEDVGPQDVQNKIGASSTGLAFNSVMALELHNGKPLSPLVNAGAMSTVSLVEASDCENRWLRILAMQQKLTGAKISLSEKLNCSEQDTNYHNRAIAWLLYSSGAMYCDPMEACDVYTRQCSTLINTVELSTIGATLASGGINPISKARVLSESNIPYILAEMAMEGMYDSSGDWAYMVGLPAKSGVGGGILAVVPGLMGIAAFSPPLDHTGNSVRGQKMVAGIARKMGYNVFAPLLRE